MTLADLSPLANHLWQSTLCVAAAWLLTLALRKNRAAVRYWVWLAASVKFLIPFSLLVSIGSQLGWRTAPVVVQPHWTSVIDDVGVPFTVSVPVIQIAVPHSSNPIPAILFCVWLCGFAVSVTFWLRCLRRVRAARRGAALLVLDLPIPVFSSRSLIEPGIFGIFRPVLLLPEGITDCLNAAQLDAIFAHEMCHVRRRDNLTAAVHMMVETIFWFHPFVWWIRTRLVEERERACDEEVLRSRSDPQVYAEGILNVCKFYLESPLTCVSGVTGSDLKKRIERIMERRVGEALAGWRRLFLTLAGVVALIGPVLFGLVDAPRIRAQSLNPPAVSPLPSFEVASIKLDDSGTPTRRFWQIPGPTRVIVTNVSAKGLIAIAYNLQPFQLSGGPGWAESKGYDIQAKIEDSLVPKLQKLPPDQIMNQAKLMLRSLLADRFKLSLSQETKELPVFTLVVAKGGPKLTPTTLTPSDINVPWPSGTPANHPHSQMTRGKISGVGQSMSMLADMLQMEPDLGGRLVLDRTGINGNYDLTLQFAQENPFPNAPPRADAPPLDPSGPSIFKALEEQLGLRLESTKGPVETFVIDHIEEPSEN